MTHMKGHTAKGIGTYRHSVHDSEDLRRYGAFELDENRFSNFPISRPKAHPNDLLLRVGKFQNSESEVAREFPVYSPSDLKTGLKPLLFEQMKL
jgi:hypothetical protein